MATLSSSAFALPLHCLSIGDSILIYWDGDRKWYPAEIIGAEGDHRCDVLYEDGEREWVSLDKVRFIVKRSERSSRLSKSNAVGAEDSGGIKNILFDIGEVPVIACRRSSRLKKDEILNLKSSSGVEEDHDAQCWAIPSMSCSREGKQHDLAPQHANKPTKRKPDDRARRSWGSRSGNLTQPKKKESCNSNSNVDTGHIEEPFDERSSGYPTTSCTFEGPDGLHCSICQTGICSNFLVQCKNSGCFCVFHTFCLHPPLQKIDEEWVCPYCEGDSLASKLAKGRQVIAKKIQRIVGHKQVIFGDMRSVVHDEFLVKWDSISHQNDSWVPREWLYVKDHVRLHNYLKKCPIFGGSDSVDERKPEWFKIDRVIACRRKHNPDEPCEIWKVCPTHQVTGEFEFLVKWKGLDYCESTWESTCTEELLAEVGRLVQRHQRAAERTENVCVSSSSESPIKTPSNLYGAILYDYQIQGLNWILSNFKANRNVILADEMGLGKTVQVVSFVSCMKQEKLTHNPVLVIAPKSILFQWEKEFYQWTKDLNVIIYQGEKPSRRCIQKHEMFASGKNVLFDALITNYEMVILDSSVLKKFKWSAIIIDEAHKIKRFDCKLASYLKRYSSDFRLLLTGTPLQNTLLELFALLHFIDPEQFSDPVAEAESYQSIKTLGRSDTENKIAEIHAILRPLMLRRMKSDVLSGSIPVKKWVEVPCGLTDCQRELYINILEKNYEKLNKEIRSGRKIALNYILMDLRKCCNHPYLFPGQETHFSSKDATYKSLVATSGKLQLLEKLLPKLKERGNRVLLFSQMTKMLDILEDFLMSIHLPYFRIDGSTPIASRQQQMKDFNAPESQVFIFLISTRAGGLGIDLPTADRVIIYDPDFNPFMDLQAQSRAHRIGQTRPVVVYQLITKLSVEEKILEKSKKKLAIENLVMNPSKKLNEEELHSVLLHGARTILNRKNLKATSVIYDEKAIDALLKLDPAPDENCSQDDNGYLGSIQSFIPGDDDNEEPTGSPKAEDWEKVLGPAQSEKDGDFGRGKRQKKVVNYESDGASDDDDVYTPEGSSSGDPSEDSESETAENNEISL